MSDWGGEDEEFWGDEDLWWGEDVENLADTLVATAWGHEPPYAPEAYDAWDSDIDDFFTDGDDDYFDGLLQTPPSSPSPSNDHISPAISQISTIISTSSSLESADGSPPNLQLSKIERRFRDAMVGKRFYGEEYDKSTVAGRPSGGAGQSRVRKRRKVSRPINEPNQEGKGEVVSVLEIGSRSGDENVDDDEDANVIVNDAIGSGEDIQNVKLRGAVKEVEIRSGVKVRRTDFGRGGSGGGAEPRKGSKGGQKTPVKAGGKKSLSPPPQSIGDIMVGYRKRKNTPLSD
ncbi:hypothetical protein BDZ91DRAFT_739506 [Kalaharituber pfeilii]|nr:hypothetical protein BDZ91DRAFT_739506 [Kalaharituber pfeilii]